jgi:hypothetical protein
MARRDFPAGLYFDRGDHHLVEAPVENSKKFMIKKPTLILLLCAIALGVGAYYFDYKRSLNPKPAEDAPKPAFAFQASDVKSLTIARPVLASVPPIHFELRNGVWQIAQPIETGADQNALEGIVNDIANAKIAQTEPGTPDRIKAFGLDTPAVSLEFQLQNGTKHTILMGNKDFTGASTYSVVDGGKSVALLPESLLVSADKSLDALRDRTVLHLTSDSVTSFTLKNKSGEIAAAKDKTDWKFSKPSAAMADADAVTALFTGIGSAKTTGTVSETSTDLAKYGLSSPAISFTAVSDKGATYTLLVGKKEGDDYFARDESRPAIFRINKDLFDKLSETYTDLRDKKLVHFDSAAIDHVEVRGTNGTIDLTRKSAEDWTIDAPADQKGKPAGIWKIFNPLADAKAEEVLDHPPADALAKLVKPALEIDLSSKNGEKISVKVSKENGDFVYAKSSSGPEIYKFKKQTLSDLDIKPADLAF